MNIVIPKPVNELMTLINDKGYESFIIGGAVRNLIMGLKPSNYDISTNGELESIKKVLKNYNTFYCGENNNRLCVVSKFPMEISKYRTPENTLEADLASRDFTMNALAYSEEEGLIDYTTGVLDITNKIIRVNGEDDTVFVSDPLRILRAIRLSAEYGMRIDILTQSYMNEDKELLRDVAPERIRDELSKLLVTPRADFYLRKYLDIFLEVLPELSLLENFNQNDPQHIYDALQHTLVSIKVVEPKLELRLAMLFHDISKPLTATKNDDGTFSYIDHSKKSADMAREIMNRLKFKKNIISKVTKLIEYHDYYVDDNEARIKQFLTKFGPDNIDDLYKIKKANFYAKNPAYTSNLSIIEEEYERIKKTTRKASFIKRNELRITGKELLEQGIEQEDIGQVLDNLYTKVLEGKLKNNHEKILEYVNNSLLKNDDSLVLQKSI